MGWAHGTNASGRAIGYGVAAVCDQEGCTEMIDRGLDYACGGMHDGGDHGCGDYFCPRHLSVGFRDDDTGSAQLCPACVVRFEGAA